MYRASIAALLAACGGGGGGEASIDARPDTPPSMCAAIPAQGQFVRRQGNPRLVAGAAFTDGQLDVRIADPDVHFDGALYQLYYAADHAPAFGDPSVAVIRHATSPDRMTWTVADAPALAANSDAAAWDHAIAGAPTVVEDPAAPAERRFVMLYAGAAGPLPGTAQPAFAIGAAFSADGATFTRVPAAESPHGQDGLVLTGLDGYPSATGALAGDPDLALVDGVYHVFFSSLACAGTDCAQVTDRGIAHATSTDAIHWTVAEAPVRSLLRASADRTSGGGQPSVIHDAEHCRWELWQTSDLAGDVAAQPVALDNMAGVWKAESTDGLAWSVVFTGVRDLTWNAAAPAAGEALGLRTGADVAQHGNGRLMLVVGFDDQDVPAGCVLPDRTAGTRPGVTTLDVATRDLP